MDILYTDQNIERFCTNTKAINSDLKKMSEIFGETYHTKIHDIAFDNTLRASQFGLSFDDLAKYLTSPLESRMFPAFKAQFDAQGGIPKYLNGRSIDGFKVCIQSFPGSGSELLRAHLE